MTILIKSIKTKLLIKKILNKNKNNMLVITSFLILLFSLILIDINFETNSAPLFVWLIIVFGWISFCFSITLPEIIMLTSKYIDKKTFSISKNEIKQLNKKERIKLNYVSSNKNIIYELNKIYNQNMSYSDKEKYKKLINN